MTEADIYQKLAELIREQKGEDFQVTEDLVIQEDFFTDSVEFMEFVIILEDAFDLEISDEETDRFSTIDTLVTYIYSKKGDKV